MTRKERQIEFNHQYKEVIKLVESGMTVENALNKLNINRGTFYYNISSEQKAFLIGLKATKCNKYREWESRDDFSELDF
jgi:predicted DNA-binding protein (UPF0251 family)